MTKTLTEQWREGTLPAGYYYIIANTKARNKIIFYLPENTNTDGAVIKGEVVNGEDGGWVLEVLGSVPDYMDCKGLIYDSIALDEARKRIDELVSKTEQLEKKLEIATKALKYYTLEDAFMSCYGNPVNPNPMVARNALKEMDGVK